MIVLRNCNDADCIGLSGGGVDYVVVAVVDIGFSEFWAGIEMYG